MKLKKRALGMVGRKVGMMRIFSDSGEATPVTVIDVSENKLSQIKTVEKDGYLAFQVSYGEKKASRVSEPLKGHFIKAGVKAGVFVKEFRLDNENFEKDFKDCALGYTFNAADLFKENAKVDVSGITIGKGFSGTIKRHNFGSQRASHGNSKSHNVPGSISMAQDPGRVFPGKKMCGQLGNDKVTIQNLKLIKIDGARGLLFVKGAIPGAKNGFVVVSPAVKS